MVHPIESNKYKIYKYIQNNYINIHECVYLYNGNPQD